MLNLTYSALDSKEMNGKILDKGKTKFSLKMM